MQDYEFLFSKNLHEKLKEKIIGKVWVKCYHDELHVKIIPGRGLEFEFTMDDFQNRILNGLSSDYIVYDVLREYKSYIFSEFLR